MPYLQANVDRPFGAMPYDQVLRISRYNKDSGAGRVFPGDFLVIEADGSVAVAAAGDTNLIGVAASPSAASTADADVLVYDHPDQLFVIQDDSDTTYAQQTHVGNNTDIIATTGDTTTGRSQHEVDISGVGTGTAQLRIVALHPVESAFATATGSPRRLVVRINEHLYSSTTGI